MLDKFLLEIGVEELPARFINNALDNLKNNFIKLLTDNRLSYGKIETFGTPRRLILYAEDIPVRQEDFYQEIQGPAYKVAYDDKGNITKAGEGFAKGKGIDVKDIIVKETEKGKYIFAPVTIKGKLAKEIFEENLVTVISQLNFPKNMIWNESKVAFARPLRWLLSFFGSELININFAGVKSSNFTFGHRLRTNNKKIEVNSIDEFFDKLKEAYVMYNQNERKEEILNQSINLAKSVGGEIIIDDKLLEQVVNLVEYPVAILGEINQEYLELPQEVLITSMTEHQKYISIKNKDGNILPYFIVISNGNPKYKDIILEGNHRVLKARLDDAKFYYIEDTKIKFENYFSKLKDVVFQVKLGTIEEKVKRVIELTREISNQLKYDSKTEEKALRTAILCKNDLVTLMLGEKEFTSLQGLIGKYYALKSGEDKEIAEGIFEHYLPRFADDIIPETKTGIAVSIADKLDTLVGIFGINLIPTGSQDPFSLRRLANGIVRIIIEKNIEIDLYSLIVKSIKLYGKKLELTPVETKKNVFDFFKSRIISYLKDNNISYDIINSLINVENALKEIYLLREKAEIINNYRDKDEFLKLVTGYKRVANITKDIEIEKSFKVDLFKHNAEIDLYKSYISCEEKLRHALRKSDFEAVLKVFLELSDPIDEYFNNVLVMDSDPVIRENKLGLLTHIRSLFLKFADFSEIVLET